MSSGVELPVSEANVAAVGDWDSTWLLRGIGQLDAFFGITFNAVVLIISVTKWRTLGPYKWFFTNLAIADFVYAVVELACETHLIVDLDNMHVYMEGFLMRLSPYWARVAFLWHYGGAFEVYISPMWIFINRYVVICKRAEEIYFTPKQTILYFLSGHIIALTAVICIGWMAPRRIIYSQLAETDWRYNYTQPLDSLGWRMFYFWFAVTAFVCYFVSIWCTVKVHNELKKNYTAIRMIHSEQKIAENKALLRTITVQGLTPVLFFLPVVISATLMTIGGVFQIHHHPLVNWSINLIKCNGALDGFVTLYTVNPYKDVITELWLRVTKKSPVLPLNPGNATSTK